MIDPAPWRFSLLGYPAGFAQPLFIALGAVALAVAALSLVRALRRRDRVERVFSPRLAGAMAPGIEGGRPAARAGLCGAGLVLLAVSLAQPQCGSRAELVKRRGIDLVVALDASKSMLARDVAPNRLERARLELLALLDELKGDRVGLVVFAGDAFVQCPLTSDYAAAKLFLRAVDPQQMPQGGTNIGAALALARKVLDNADRGAKARAVVLISDGEDLAGEVEEGLTALKQEGIKLYAVGIGSEIGEPIPVANARGEVAGYQKDERGQTVLTRLNRGALTQLAQATGGEFFYQPNGVAMGEVIQRIDRLQKSDLESRIAVRFDERFEAYAIPGTALLWVGMVLGAWRRRD